MCIGKLILPFRDKKNDAQTTEYKMYASPKKKKRDTTNI